MRSIKICMSVMNPSGSEKKIIIIEIRRGKMWTKFWLWLVECCPGLLARQRGWCPGSPPSRTPAPPPRSSTGRSTPGSRSSSTFFSHSTGILVTWLDVLHPVLSAQQCCSCSAAEQWCFITPFLQHNSVVPLAQQWCFFQNSNVISSALQYCFFRAAMIFLNP